MLRALRIALGSLMGKEVNREKGGVLLVVVVHSHLRKDYGNFSLQNT